jgi:hypothetical protein
MNICNYIYVRSDFGTFYPITSLEDIHAPNLRILFEDFYIPYFSLEIRFKIISILLSKGFLYNERAKKIVQYILDGD